MGISSWEGNVKRIDILYGGELYSVGQMDFEAVREEVEYALSSGSAWLRVNDGEGAPREAYLLLSPGVPIALIPVPDDEEERENLGDVTIEP